MVNFTMAHIHLVCPGSIPLAFRAGGMGSAQLPRQLHPAQPRPRLCLTSMLPPRPCTQGNATTNGPPIVYLVPSGNAAEDSALPMLDPPRSGSNRECAVCSFAVLQCLAARE